MNGLVEREESLKGEMLRRFDASCLHLAPSLRFQRANLKISVDCVRKRGIGVSIGDPLRVFGVIRTVEIRRKLGAFTVGIGPWGEAGRAAINT